MNPVTQHLISSYLLMPLLTVIFGIAAYFIARKNKLLNNRKLIVYLLLCGMILALPALCGFMDYSFMPYVYILLVVLYWTAGHYNRFILRKVFAQPVRKVVFLLREMPFVDRHSVRPVYQRVFFLLALFSYHDVSI
jgi:amino acid transporter